MIERRVIHSTGEYRWQLAVCGDDVTASRQFPNADGSIYYTTADFDLGRGDMGADNCSPDRVVAAYRKHARVDEPLEDLLASVRDAIEKPPTETTDARPVATDGGTDQ